MLFDDRRWPLGIPVALLALAGGAVCLGVCFAALGLLPAVPITGQNPLAVFIEGLLGMMICATIAVLLIGGMRRACRHARLRIAAMSGATEAVPLARIFPYDNNAAPKRFLIEERQPLDIRWGRWRPQFRRPSPDTYIETPLPFWARSTLQGSAVAVMFFEMLLIVLGVAAILLVCWASLWSLFLLGAWLLAQAPGSLGQAAAPYAPMSSNLPDALVFLALGVFLLPLTNWLLHRYVYRITATAAGITRREWYGRRHTIRWADVRHFEVASRNESAGVRIQVYRLYSQRRMIWWSDNPPYGNRHWQVQSLNACVQAQTGLALRTFEPAVMQSPPPPTRGKRWLAHWQHRQSARRRGSPVIRFQWHVTPRQHLRTLGWTMVRRQRSRVSYAVAFTLAIFCQLAVTAVVNAHPPTTNARFNDWLAIALALTALAFALGWLGIVVYTLASPFFIRTQGQRSNSLPAPQPDTAARYVALPAPASFTENNVYEFRQRMRWHARIVWALAGLLLLLDALPWLLWTNEVMVLHQAAQAHITRAFLVYGAVLLALPVCIGGTLFVNALIAAPTVVRADCEGISLWHGRNRRALIPWDQMANGALLYRFDEPQRYRVYGRGKTISWPAIETTQQRKPRHRRGAHPATPAELAAVVSAHTGQQIRIWQLGMEG